MVNLQRSRRVSTAAVVTVIIGLVAACAPPPHPFVTRTPKDLDVTCDPEASAPPGSVVADGRRASLVAPSDWEPGEPYPLMVSLHPFVLAADGWETYSGLAAAASQRGYFVLVPRGSDPGPRWAVPGGLPGGPDDIGWIDDLIVETARQVCLDGRVVAAGFSAGAAMAMALSCELPWRFAAVVAVSGSNLTERCPPALGGPVDTLIMHGTADPIAPLAGSYVIFAPPLGLAVSTVVDDAAERNDCTGSPAGTPMSATVTAYRFTCADGRVEFWELLGGGHTWPGATIPLDAVTGPTDRSIDANDVVLDFVDVEA